MTSGWRLLEMRESAADFHARLVPEAPAPEIWWNRIPRPAIVLGSTQRDASILDVEACRSAGIDVVRRRSGGGVVLLVPGSVTWVDVVVPAGGHGWSDDVHVVMRWLGGHLAALVGEGLGSPGRVQVHEGPLITTPWSRLICFDGLGPGEVTLDGAKLIGISQRRTRAAARVQCSWYSTFDPQVLVGLLAGDVRPDVGDLNPVATLSADLAAALPGRLLHRLNDIDPSVVTPGDSG